MLGQGALMARIYPEREWRINLYSRRQAERFDEQNDRLQPWSPCDNWLLCLSCCAVDRLPRALRIGCPVLRVFQPKERRSCNGRYAQVIHGARAHHHEPSYRGQACGGVAHAHGSRCTVQMTMALICVTSYHASRDAAGPCSSKMHSDVHKARGYSENRSAEV